MYKNKYLKYKQKYLYLKGGSIISEISDTDSLNNEFRKIFINYGNNSRNLCSFMSSLCDNSKYLIENKELIKKIIARIDYNNNGNELIDGHKNKLSYDINTIIDKNTNELIDKLTNNNIKTACKNVVDKNLNEKDSAFKLIKLPLKFNYIINRFLNSNYNLPEHSESTEYIAIYTEYNRIMYNNDTPKKETNFFGSSEKFDAYHKRYAETLIVGLDNTTKKN
jgi:hypothetical protein